MQFNYLEAYIEETEEQLCRLEQLFLELEKQPEDKEVLDEIFRIMHTLKGSSGVMGFEDISNFSHELEDFFDGLRKGKIRISGNAVDVLFGCLDVLKAMVNCAVNGEAYNDNTAKLLLEDLNALVQTQVTEIKPQRLTVFVKIAPDCTMKAARALLIANEIERRGSMLSMNPSKEELLSAHPECEEVVAVIETQDTIENIRKALENMQDVVCIEVKPEEVSVVIDLSSNYNLDAIKRLINDLARTDVLELRVGNKPRLTMAMLMLILSAQKSNKTICCKEKDELVGQLFEKLGVVLQS